MNYSIDRAQIKLNPKAQLQNNIFSKTWLMALVALLIYSIIYSLSGYLVVGPLILGGPLMIGVSLVFIKIARGYQDVDLGDLFVSFSNRFVQDLLLGLMIAIYTFLWSLLFVIPGIIKSYAYSMAYYISLDHPEYTWQQCIDESVKMTNGHKGELFVLDLSFIGWYLLGYLCCGIGMFFVMPYHMTAKANYYEALRAGYYAQVNVPPVA